MGYHLVTVSGIISTSCIFEVPLNCFLFNFHFRLNTGISLEIEAVGVLGFMPSNDL